MELEPTTPDIKEVSVRIRKRSERDFELDLAVALPAGNNYPVWPVGDREDYDTRLHRWSGSTGRRPNRNPKEDVLFDSALGINLPPQLRRVGYVFQDLALFPHMTVQGNVGMVSPGFPLNSASSAAPPYWNRSASPI